MNCNVELNEIIKKPEGMRKKKNMYAWLAVGCFAGIMPVTFICSLFADTIGAILGFISIFILMFIFLIIAGRGTTEYKKIYKESFVVGILNQVFDNVTYKYNDGLSENYVRQFGLVRMGNRYSSEDYIKASYKGIEFQQAQVKIKYEKKGNRFKFFQSISLFVVLQR